MLSIICPTRNESGNIKLLIKKIEETIDFDHEIIFVDDNSNDGTVELIKQTALENRRIKIISRFKEKNLSSAVALGISSALFKYAIVIDADLQHDISNIKRMYDEAYNSELDLVISSRFLENNNLGYSKKREYLSRVGNNFINKLTNHPLTDPLSGCFLINVEFFEKNKHRLILKGYKILFDILSSYDLKDTKLKEIPINFYDRNSGESKLSNKVIYEFILSYLIRIIEKIFPLNFIKFGLVGLIGVLFHLIILNFFIGYQNFSFGISQYLAALMTMTLNFYLNNIFTFKDNKLVKLGFYRGLVKFIIFCSLGAFISAAIGDYVFSSTGYVNLAALIGIIFGSITNYVLNYRFTWNFQK